MAGSLYLFTGEELDARPVHNAGQPLGAPGHALHPLRVDHEVKSREERGREAPRAGLPPCWAWPHPIQGKACCRGRVTPEALWALAPIPTPRLIMETSLEKNGKHWTFGAKGHGTIMSWLQLQPFKKPEMRTQPPRCSCPWGEGGLAMRQLGTLSTRQF